MANIVINKNFNEKYLSTAYKLLFTCDYDTSTYKCLSYDNNTVYTEAQRPFVFNDLRTFNDNWWAGMQAYNIVPVSYLLVNESVLNFFNTINKKYKDVDSIPDVPVNVGDTRDTNSYYRVGKLRLRHLMDTLLCPVAEYRNNAIDFFVELGDITEEEAISIKDNIMPLVYSNISDNVGLSRESSIKHDDIVVTQNENNITFENNNTMKLVTPYIHNVNNPNNENLYIMVVPYSDTKFISGNYETISFYNDFSAITTDQSPTFTYSYNNKYGGLWHTGYQQFHRKDTNTTVEQIPYIALSLSTPGAGGEIQFDHLDEIEYIDGFKFQVTLPKVYS